MTYEQELIDEFKAAMAEFDIRFAHIKDTISRPTFVKIMKGQTVSSKTVIKLREKINDIIKFRKNSIAYTTSRKGEVKTITKTVEETYAYLTFKNDMPVLDTNELFPTTGQQPEELEYDVEPEPEPELEPPESLPANPSNKKDMLARISAHVDTKINKTPDVTLVFNLENMSQPPVVATPGSGEIGKEIVSFEPQQPSTNNHRNMGLDALISVMSYKEPTLVFIDGPNLTKAIERMAYVKRINYSGIRDFFFKHSYCKRINYYSASVANEYGFIPRKRLFDWLENNGYNLVTRHVDYRTDSQGIPNHKTNMDIELAVGMVLMLKTMPEVRHAVLFSGDGDFISVINALKANGVRTTVIAPATTEVGSKSTHDDLKLVPDLFIPLEDLIRHVGGYAK